MPVFGVRLRARYGNTTTQRREQETGETCSETDAESNSQHVCFCCSGNCLTFLVRTKSSGYTEEVEARAANRHMCLEGVDLAIAFPPARMPICTVLLHGVESNAANATSLLTQGAGVGWRPGEYLR